MIRLDKALSSMGIGSRNDVKKMLRDNRVKINGEIVRSGAVKIAEDADITIDDMPFVYEKFTYIMMNKPQGVISATEGYEPTVIDLLEMPVKGLFPCGRLDKDTTGLLLLTNDGQLAHRLLSPKHHVEKEYEVVLAKPVSDEDIAKIASGIQDGEDQFMPAENKKLTETSGMIILHEGKFHEIKRIFLSLGNEVVSLKRIRMKNLVLDESLAEGMYRPLTEEEIKGLQDPPADVQTR